jgi:phosphatidate cytidylyltransferase
MILETTQRIVMGIVMAIIVMAAIMYSSSLCFFIAVAGVLLLTGYEWIALITDKYLYKIGYIIVLLACLIGISRIMLSQHMLLIILFADLAAIIICIAQLFIFSYNQQNDFVHNKLFRVALSLVMLSSAQLFIVLLRYHGNFWIVYGLALVAMFDTGAYFAGRSFGKHLLAKKISPKKTWEGFLGGCGLGLLLSIGMILCFHRAYPLTMSTWFFVVFMTVLMAVFSVFGDLFESLQKRLAGKKDSSRMIPGHGGFYDRIDALLFVLPLMFIYREFLVFLINTSVMQYFFKSLN